jgi:hypothetical protein
VNDRSRTPWRQRLDEAKFPFSLDGAGAAGGSLRLSLTARCFVGANRLGKEDLISRITGAFWGGFWGLFLGGLFLTVPAVGHVVVLGYLATVAITAIENAVVVGGLSALGAALYSMGIPKDSVIQYETAVKADSFLVMAQGTAEEIARAKTILSTASPSRLDVHAGANAADPAGRLGHAGG